MREDERPYSERAEWKDVTPIPQDDGQTPLAVIRYPAGFEEVHGYFRAIQQLGEFGERALQLTADVIEQNSANYTAWYYRRRCLKELSSDLKAELAFIDKWARDCPKNYQVWYHRRWLISEIADGIRKTASLPEEAEKAIQELADCELDYHMDVMMVNDDYKNYNGWSHRHFIVSKFGMWDREMKFVEDLLQDDIRNNSAWNHKHTVVRNTSCPLTDDVRRREVDFTLKALRKCANNESAWNYLAAFLGEGNGKVAWNYFPAVEALCLEILAMAEDRETLCRFAVEAMARIHEAKSELDKAQAQYHILKDIDKIRSNYWDWRCALLVGQASTTVAS